MAYQTQTAPQAPSLAAFAAGNGLGFDPSVLETFDGTWHAYRTALLERVFGRATP